MQGFSSFGLPLSLTQSLERMGYTDPTPIQAQAIPVALEGKDILGSAQTGTGKTAAFSIPIVARLMHSPRGSAVILLPTRELAVQVADVIRKMLGQNHPIKTALLIGGESMHPQLQQLRARPRIIIGTPGRINDHLERGSLMLRDAGILVLDETDRMLDMGFGVQIERIARFLPPVRQTLMFSATLPSDIMKLSARYLKEPVRIAVGEVSAVATNLKQEVIHTTDATKYSDLLKELDARQGSVIVFVKTKRGCDRLADKLNRNEHSADAIHGDLMQRKRDRVIADFRNKKYRIMVATDVAARGLDIPHIEHVINYDLPQRPEDYIHRIGRTARAGAEGSAVCLISPEDRGKWKAIHRLMNPQEAAAEQARGGAGRPEGQRRRRPQGKRRFGPPSAGRAPQGERRAS